MGFMDKAKKMAEQAQAKLDEAQKQFNEKQGASAGTAGSGPVVQYDAHGRPVQDSTPAPPAPSAPPAPEAQPHGDPVGASTPPPPPAPPAPEPAAEPSDEYAPPKLSSGDPLEG
jgi:hypothetical protein